MKDQDAERAEILPLFPLASVVLFPQVRVPLYIFEPRYRQMIESALGASGRIGMVTIRYDQIGRIAEDPEIFPVGCAGQLEACKQRSDGTYDILLAGVYRFRVEREIARPSGQLYREAQVSILSENESESSAGDTERVRSDVHERYGRLLARVAPEYLEVFRSRSFASMPDAVYANTISVSLNIEAVEKQSLLESSSTRVRLERLLTILEFKLVEPATRGAVSPPSIQ